MFSSTDDLRITNLRPLLPPAILIEEIPVTSRAADTVNNARLAVSGIVAGHDPRLLVVVGPCSIHDVKAAREYAERLRAESSRLEELLLVMRVYFEKPRTTVGWKGLINDPFLDESFAINQGLRLARSLLADLADQGVAAGTEFLDTITPQFVADLISWGAIGARTTESQMHRELASGLSMPVGFKNGTDGSVQIALDAIRAARHPHSFLSVTKQGIAAIVSTRGNESCHVILRGANSGPNHDAASVEQAAKGLEKASLTPRLMIDLSHGNSQKDYRRQPLIAEDVSAQIEGGSRQILGVMIESHLTPGRQDVLPGKPLVYGQSITDACLGWSETVPVLERLARAVKNRPRG